MSEVVVYRDVVFSVVVWTVVAFDRPQLVSTCSASSAVSVPVLSIYLITYLQSFI